MSWAKLYYCCFEHIMNIFNDGAKVKHLFVYYSIMQGMLLYRVWLINY